MALCINQSGSWRNITTQCVKESGTWRKVVDGCVNQSGTWRCFGMTAPTVSLSASPTSVVQGSSSTLTWSSTKATTISSNFGATATSGTCVVTPSSTTTYCMCATNPFTTSSTATATVTVTVPALGSAYEGGYLICRSSGINWILAPSSSEVRRSFTYINDGVTTAQSVTGCTGWFIPTCGQMQNPGLVCKTYWDTYGTVTYWSSTPYWGINICYDQVFPTSPAVSFCIRAFRCVTY